LVPKSGLHDKDDPEKAGTQSPSRPYRYQRVAYPWMQRRLVQKYHRHDTFAFGRSDGCFNDGNHRDGPAVVSRARNQNSRVSDQQPEASALTGEILVKCGDIQCKMSRKGMKKAMKITKDPKKLGKKPQCDKQFPEGVRTAPDNFNVARTGAHST